MSKAHVSDAKTYEFFILPKTKGRIPNGSRAPINFLLLIMTNA